VIAPETMRTLVKLAGSMLVCLNAMRQRIELGGKRNERESGCKRNSAQESA